MFPELLSKPATLSFTGQNQSSDGGLVLLKAADRKLKLSEALAACVSDSRRARSVRHPFGGFLFQRIASFACGYPDANDFNSLRQDEVWKKISGQNLPSQPTVSRFENALKKKDLKAMNHALAEAVFKQMRSQHKGQNKVKHITLDMDGTDDPTHGQQEFSCFNGHYDRHCFLPLLAFASFKGQAEQFLVASQLRPGDASAGEDGVKMLKGVLKKCRRFFPQARILVRLDAGFANPEMLDFLDEAQVGYLVSYPKNATLLKQIRSTMKLVSKCSRESGESEQAYGHFLYKTAKSWKRQHRIIYKAEVIRQEGMFDKDNPRFVVTNLQGCPERLYKLYCGRGDSENRIKELKLDLNSGRTSCQDFQANRFRLLLASAAFVLLQFMRSLLKLPLAKVWQAGTLRLRLIKVAVTFKESVRRLLFTFARAFPGKEAFLDLAAALGAT